MNNPMKFTDPSGYFSKETKDFIDAVVGVLWGLPDGSSWSAAGRFSIGYPDLSSGSKISKYMDQFSSGGGGSGSAAYTIRQVNVSRRNGSPLFPWVTGDGKLHKDPHIQLIIEPVLEPLLPESPHHSNENTFFITRESGDPPIGGAGGGAVNSDINVSNEGNPPTPEALFNEGKLEKPYPNNEVLYSYWKQGYNYGVEGDYINYHWQKWVIGYQGINPSNELRVNLENSGNVIPRIEAISRGYEYGLQYNFNYNQFQ